MSTTRSRTTRRQRIIRALTPKRVRRTQARWRRRARKAKQRYASFRDIVRRDPTTTCGDCGKRVAQGKLKAHLARHDAQNAKTGGAAQRKRARNRPKAAPASRSRKKPEATPSPSPGCDGTCANSDMDDDEAKARGVCVWCCGRKELITNFGGKHVHVPCPKCSGTGSHSTQSKAGQADDDGDSTASPQRGQPSRTEAGSRAAPWLALGSVLMALFTVLGLGPWLVVAGAGAVAVGALAYWHERRHGTSEHPARYTRRDSKRAAREAGCSAACMQSAKPAGTCRCPCGGATHGMGRSNREAA